MCTSCAAGAPQLHIGAWPLRRPAAVEPDERDARALGDGAAGGLGADAARGAGDDADAALQAPGHGSGLRGEVDGLDLGVAGVRAVCVNDDGTVRAAASTDFEATTWKASVNAEAAPPVP